MKRARPAWWPLSALLLLAGAGPARADDGTAPPPAANPAAPPQTFDPADANRDGTVTPRERRRYNRKLRRAKRKASGGESDAQADADDAAQQRDDDAADAAAAHGDAALSGASSAAGSLKSSLTDPGAAGGLPGAAGAAGGKISAARGGPSGDPANPSAPSDFVLAARSGYAPAFKAAGLKLSADGRSVVRLDGTPATPADLARLRSGILAMPAALSRRPDFFTQVTPARFAELKDGYRADPRLSKSVYKDVGMTAGDRDFVNTESCAKLEGGCNAYVEKPSYKKGDFVAPDDLDRMWGGLQKELDEEESLGGGGPASGRGTPEVAEASDAHPLDGRAAHETATGTGSAASAPGSATLPAPLAAAAAATRKFFHATATALGFGPAQDGKRASRAPAATAAAAIALAAFLLSFRRRFF